MQNTTLHSSREPLYLQVAEVLRQRIVRGDWRVGDRLPSLLELAEEFSVARVTARQAVKLLEEEGYVAPKRGRGTTVLERPEGFQKFDVKTRLSEMIELYRKDVPDVDLLEDRSASLPAYVEGQRCEGYHMLRRTHARDGKRYCVIDLYLARGMFERHEKRLRSELALPVMLDAPDIEIATARQTMTIGKCDMENAALLGLSVGEPIANVRRTICDGQGVVLYFADVIYRGDFIILDMDLMA